MTQNDCERAARIIEDVFYLEEEISPKTIVYFFRKLGALLQNNSYDENDTDSD